MLAENTFRFGIQMTPSNQEERMSCQICEKTMFIGKCPHNRMTTEPTKQSEPPREFWIEKFNGRKNPSYYAFKDKPNFNRIQLKEDDGTVIQGYEYFNVIEKSAYDQLAAQVSRLESEARLHDTIVKSLQRGQIAYCDQLRAELDDYREALARLLSSQALKEAPFYNYSEAVCDAQAVLAKWAKVKND